MSCQCSITEEVRSEEKPSPETFSPRRTQRQRNFSFPVSQWPSANCALDIIISHTPTSRTWKARTANLARPRDSNALHSLSLSQFRPSAPCSIHLRRAVAVPSRCPIKMQASDILGSGKVVGLFDRKSGINHSSPLFFFLYPVIGKKNAIMQFKRLIWLS